MMITVSLAAGACGEAKLEVRERCAADVVGIGLVDIESDYLPHVVACENGNGDFEALKAQAVAARSYLYYVMAQRGSIIDGTADQVYSCDREVRAEHREAVAATWGQILVYDDVPIAAFFVAGATVNGETCAPTRRDPSRTQRFVTDNHGLRGDAVAQTSLGNIDARNLANRGCMSQLRANCLANRGFDYRTILRHFYGADIAIAQAQGPCLDSPPPAAEPPSLGPGVRFLSLFLLLALAFGYLRLFHPRWRKALRRHLREVRRLLRGR